MILLLPNIQRSLMRGGSISASPHAKLLLVISIKALRALNIESVRGIGAGSIRLDEAIERYLADWGVGNPSTAKAKRYDLNHFADFVELELGSDIPTLGDITRAVCVRFRDSRVAVEKPSTIDRRLKTLRHFFKIQIDAYQDLRNPTIGVWGPKYDGADPACLTWEEKEAIREAVTPGRNRLVIELGFLLGLRNNEIRKLRKSHFTPDLSVCTVNGKDSYFARVPVHQKLIGFIVHYLPERAVAIGSKDAEWDKLPDNYPLVISTYGAVPGEPESFELDNKSIWRIVSTAGAKAGIDAWTHRLRHTFIRNVYETSNNDAWLAQKAARHRSAMSMQPYSRVQVETVRDALESLT